MNVEDDAETEGAAGAAKTDKDRMAVLEEAAEVYELYTIALYDLEGQLIQGIDIIGNLQLCLFQEWNHHPDLHFELFL